jgi:hypothetical protein
MRRERNVRGLIWDPISALFKKIKSYENTKKSIGLYLLPRRCEFSSFPTYIPDSHLHRVTYARCCIDTIDSPDDKHMFAWNM